MTRKHRRQPVSVSPCTINIPPSSPWHVRWARRAIYAALILSPLLFLSPDIVLPNPTDMPRRCCWRWWPACCWPACLRGWALSRQVRLHRHLLDIPVLLYFLGALIAGMRGAYPHVSLFSTLWAQDFTALPALGIGVALYFGMKEFIHGEQRGRRCRLRHGGGRRRGGGHRAHRSFRRNLALHPAFSGPWPQPPGGHAGQPDVCRHFFRHAHPAGLGVALGTAQPRRRPWLLASLVVMALALLFTQTRSSWLGLAVTLVLFALLALWRRRVTGQRIAPAVLASSLAIVLVMLALGLLLPQVRARLVSIVNKRDETRVTREVYMTTAWRMFRARPVTGWGPGTLREIFPQFRPSSTVIENGFPLNRGYSASLPHNLPLQIAAEMGLCGLLPFAALLLLLLIAACRLVANPAAPGWLGMGLLGLLLANLLSNLTLL